MNDFITGIQQVGIGVNDACEAKLLYKDLFGMNVLVFEDRAEAGLMTKYTGSELHARHAVLSLNMAGGGGFEIWQFTSRTATRPKTPVKLGDTGIFAVNVKTRNAALARQKLTAQKTNFLSQIQTAPDNSKHFWLQDGYGNLFNIVEGDEWFKTDHYCGGVTGAVIGVNNMDAALHFYKEVLGIGEQVYDVTGPFEDSPTQETNDRIFRRVLLRKKTENKGAFSKLLGSVQIELVQALDTKSNKIFAGRFWGDCGFIHLCFDVLNMDALKHRIEHAGYPFTVDSAESFPMGESAGRFCYVEDPDGTLIELVETHKVAVLKKMGWYLDLKKRKHNRPLPNWMVGMLALNKIK